MGLPRRNVERGAGLNQARHAVRVRPVVLEREYRPPGVTEHVDLVKAEVGAKSFELGHKMRDVEQRGIRDLRRIPASELVVADDLPSVSYCLERLQVAACKPGTA